MDLKLVPHAEPTDERARCARRRARPARVGWEGGAREPAPTGTRPPAATPRARGDICCCRRSGRSRSGSAGSARAALNEICRRLTVPPADAYGVATFYALFALEPRPPRVVHVCEDIACRCHGSDELIAQLEERFGPEGELSDDGSATWYRSPCLGQCDRAPAALVGDRGRRAARRVAGADDGRGGARRCSRAASPARRPRLRCRRRAIRRFACSAASASSIRASLDDYRAHGGYAALRRAVELGPEGVLREVKDSKLVGRGGAAFPTGRQVGGGRAPAGAAALPRLQRRRVGARDVQGPRR